MFGEPIWGNPALFFRIGFCPEQDAFYERMTGLEWVTALVRLNGYDDTEAAAAARAALEHVDLLTPPARRSAPTAKACASASSSLRRSSTTRDCSSSTSR